ncbi:hypothetical protein ACFX2B_039834 [Malus domestica]
MRPLAKPSKFWAPNPATDEKALQSKGNRIRCHTPCLPKVLKGRAITENTPCLPKVLKGRAITENLERE